MEKVRALIRDIPDFPKPGIVFKDITPLLENGEMFKFTINQLAKQVEKYPLTHVVAIESRGFIFGSALALQLGLGLVIVRKPGKLPHKTKSIEYALEYGSDRLEMHVDSLDSSHRVLIVDDILATGGTAKATADLVSATGAKVDAIAFLSELSFLKGRDKLAPYSVISLISF